jgi:hypothetical protein
MQIELSKEQIEFIKNILSQIQINAANPEAALIVEKVQGILTALHET